MQFLYNTLRNCSLPLSVKNLFNRFCKYRYHFPFEPRILRSPAEVQRAGVNERKISRKILSIGSNRFSKVGFCVFSEIIPLRISTDKNDEFHMRHMREKDRMPLFGKSLSRRKIAVTSLSGKVKIHRHECHDIRIIKYLVRDVEPLPQSYATRIVPRFSAFLCLASGSLSDYDDTGIWSDRIDRFVSFLMHFGIHGVFADLIVDGVKYGVHGRCYYVFLIYFI